MEHGMALKLYLVRNRISVKKMSEDLMYGRTHLSLIMNGKSFPSARLARDIERYTNGEITVKDLRPETQEINAVL